MKKKINNHAANFDEDDLRPEYRFDYSKAKRNRFASDRTDPRRLIIILDPDIPDSLSPQKFKKVVAAKWREFAADLVTSKRQLGLESNHGLLLAGVLISLLQAYETDAQKTMTALPALLGGSDKAKRFANTFFTTVNSFWELEKIVRDDTEMAHVFDTLIKRSESMQAAQLALGAEWESFSEQLKAEQAHPA